MDTLSVFSDERPCGAVGIDNAAPEKKPPVLGRCDHRRITLKGIETDQFAVKPRSRTRRRLRAQK
jgi:hypothetical protein